MKTILIGIFFILHGLVHLLYAGQSQRYVELQHDMVWPDGSWAFSRLFGDETTRLLATIALVLAAFSFVASGLGLFIHQAWWRSAILMATVLSSAVFILFWDGKFQQLPDKGWIGILINIIILVVV